MLGTTDQHVVLNPKDSTIGTRPEGEYPSSYFSATAPEHPVSSQAAEVDGQNPAEDIPPYSLRNSPRPGQLSTEHPCSPDQSAHATTYEQLMCKSDADSDLQDESTSPSTLSTDVLTASDIGQEPLSAEYDKAEWDSNILWHYIENYREATVYSSSIIPPEKLDCIVNQFLIDRECWDERSGADTDVAIMFLALSIGKLYAKMPRSSSLLGQPAGYGQSTQVHGSTFFELGKNTFYESFSTDLIKNVQAKVLIGFYYYQLGIISNSYENLGSASKLARYLLRL